MLSEKAARFNLGCIRRASLLDKRPLSDLITKECYKIFGDFKIQTLIELCYLPICQMDMFGEILGFVALELYPNCPAIPQHDWISWIHNLYALYNVRAQNTLFVHMICWEVNYSRIFLRSFLESVFKSDPYLSYIIFVMPHDSPESVISEDTSFSNILLRVNPKGHYDNENFQFLYVAIRNRFCPKLKVRKAVEEDNDDLVAIIHRQSEYLKELYGDFYISELIAHPQGSERVVLVGEHNGVPVGVMVLNTQINYRKLIENFELSPFFGLRKETSTQRKRHTALSHVNEESPPSESNRYYVESQVLHEYEEEAEEKEVDKGVLDGKTAQLDIKEVDDKLFLDHSHSDGSISKMSIKSCIDMELASSCTCLSHDSEDDYDIVNVDENLFIKIDHFVDDILQIGTRKTISRVKTPESEASSFMSLFKKLKSVDVPLLGSRIDEEQSSESLVGRNAFIIEIFAMDESFDERYGFDILETSFEVYPDLDYCIISIPSDVKTFPLLDHFVFIPLRSTGTFSHCLYAAHRNSIRSELTVREADFIDVPQIKNLVKNLPGSRSLIKDFLSIVTSENNDRFAFVMVSEDEIIGLSTLEDSEDYNCIRHNYDTFADVTPKPHGYLSAIALQHMVLAPQFQPHARFFLRELLRQSQMFEIFWPHFIHRNYDITSLGRNIMSTISEFLPLLSKTLMDFNEAHYERYKRFPKSKKMDDSQITMSYINLPICSFPKIQVNMNIVIVGASNTAFAFLEAILFGPSSAYLTFNNLTLISNHGIPCVQQSSKAAVAMIVETDHVDMRITNTTPVQAYIHVVTDTMTMIKRQEKYIVVTGNKRLSYDLLFLFCGEQYQHPHYLKQLKNSSKDTECKHNPDSLFSTSFVDITFPKKPYNLFIINDIIDANIALSCLPGMISSSTKNLIIVYGATIDAYCCIEALLVFGIPGHCIAFVEPFPSTEEGAQQVSFFNNEYIDDAVRQNLLKNKIKVYSKYYFHSWQYCRKAKLIYSVKFTSYYKMLELHCMAMFYYGNRDVDTNTFLAINECGLVYNGRLVINSYCQTNDMNIFAAGTLTKYSQKYNAPHLDHKHFSRCEIGFKLGEIILHNLNPFSNTCAFKSEELYLFGTFGNTESAFTAYRKTDSSYSINLSITSLKSIEVRGCSSNYNILMKNLDYPFAQQCSLMDLCSFPGGLTYMNISAPGVFVPLELAMTRDDFGRDLVTKTNGYFRIHFDRDNIVTAITCLTEETLDIHNLLHLWGRHEQMLNSIFQRFDDNQIPDLFEYFRQPWVYAIYHDKFDLFLRLLKEKLHRRWGENFEGIPSADQFLFLGTSDNEGPEMDRLRQQRSVHYLEMRNVIKNELVSFIEDNEQDLPMYVHPRLARDIFKLV